MVGNVKCMGGLPMKISRNLNKNTNMGNTGKQRPRNGKLPIHGVSVSFDDEIDAELERRSIFQYNDDEDDDPHWDEGKLYWARKMFREGAKWANERLVYEALPSQNLIE